MKFHILFNFNITDNQRMIEIYYFLKLLRFLKNIYIDIYFKSKYAIFKIETKESEYKKKEKDLAALAEQSEMS